MLAEIREELTKTTQSLKDVSDTLESGIAPFRSSETKLKGEIEEHKKQEKELQPKFDRVSGGVTMKTKKANSGRSHKMAAVRVRSRRLKRTAGTMNCSDLSSIASRQIKTSRAIRSRTAIW